MIIPHFFLELFFWVDELYMSTKKYNIISFDMCYGMLFINIVCTQFFTPLVYSFCIQYINHPQYDSFRITKTFVASELF